MSGGKVRFVYFYYVFFIWLGVLQHYFFLKFFWLLKKIEQSTVQQRLLQLYCSQGSFCMDLCVRMWQGQLCGQEGPLTQRGGICPALRMDKARGHIGPHASPSKASSLVLGQGVVILQVIILGHNSHTALALAVCWILVQHAGVPLQVLGMVEFQAVTPLWFGGWDHRLREVFLLLVEVSGVFLRGRWLPGSRPVEIFGEPHLLVVHSQRFLP